MSTYRKVHLLADVEQDGCCKDRLHDLGPQSIVEARKPCTKRSRDQIAKVLRKSVAWRCVRDVMMRIRWEA